MALDITPQSPTQVVLTLASKNQDALKTVSKQISSGFKYDDFKGFAGDATTENFLSFSSTLTGISTYISSNTSALSRAKTMDSSIKTIQGLANDLAALITQRRNSASGGNIPVDVEAKGVLDKVAGALNVKFDGRFLFAGSKTNTQPVTNIQTSNVDSTTTPPTAKANYYQGDSSIVSVRSSDSETISYGVLASDQGFKDLIAAAHLAIDGHAANDDTKLGQAMDKVNEAISGLISSRATTQIASNRMTKANATHQDFQLLIEGNLNKISQTDIVQATAKMSELQAIVQAGYLAYSRLTALKLSDYLR